MRNAGLEEAQAGIKIEGDISITSDMEMTPGAIDWAGRQPEVNC